MSTRITGGEFKGRILQTPKGNNTRPTSSRLRESLFSVLADEVNNAKVIDLYAGSGSVGIEAVSRGALNATLVENNFSATRVISANIQTLKAKERIFLNKGNAEQIWAGMQKGDYDIIFIDPPFVKEFPDFSDIRSKLAEGCTGVIQYPSRNFPEWLDMADKQKKYGESGLAFFYE